ncbi:radical SAM protein [uncultured Chitinophaga sp.]|jgi:radical SAM additional 4Fe4S-binding domain|uniref:radical SAM/SPASM domain-containing protein n=1 Tax=uncultured Chitinophaga sp. TaxID=339340 RepID=UPI0026399632|nr:radical SAM protein [uncultured Chitinophaga sp.]
MSCYKTSFYNVLVPVEEEQEYLLYNLVSGGLEVLPWEEGKFIGEITGPSPVDFKDYPQHWETLQYLYEKGFLVEEHTDEKKLYHQQYAGKQHLLYDRESASINLTIGTTILCNMGCAYCFEFVKPNKSLKDEKNFEGIMTYLEDMIRKSPVKRWEAINITWYGGEPLINKGALAKLSPLLWELSRKYSMDYNASIITNGILLTKENWLLLKEHHVQNVQVTIDGPREKHDKSRPLKGKKGGRNYELIMENLTYIPDGMQATIRINTDREVAESIDVLFSDFKNYGLWPQRYNAVTFSPAWLRTYEEANETDTSARLNVEEFYDFLQMFRKKRVKLFNEWAEQNSVGKARLKWMLPEIQEECATWVSPYSLVMDPEGNIHKCWETIHESKQAISHVSQGFDLETHRKFMEYDRCELNSICANCKYMPVCDKLSCSHQAIKEGKPPCTFWKTKTEESLKDQYLLMKREPDTIVLPKHLMAANTGHSNK